MSDAVVLKLEPLLQARLAIFDDANLTRDEQMWGYYKPGIAYLSQPVDVRAVTIPGERVSVPARLYQAVDDADRCGIALVWFHGGGFVSGDLEVVEADVIAQELVCRAGVTVLSVDYRLCNEGVTFPAPQDDGVAGVRWMLNHQQELGCDSVFVGGGSAGACLTGSVVQMLRDAGMNEVAGALMFYPIAHVRIPEFDEWHRARHAALPEALAFDPEWSVLHNERLMGRSAATATGHDFPGEGADLHGLPPTLIVNAEYDSLAISGERFAQQLARAGVEVTLLTEPGVTHGHLAYAPQELAAADHSIDLMIRFMQGHARAVDAGAPDA